MKTKHSFSLKIILVFGMVGLILGTVIFIILTSYVSSRKVFLNHSRDLMANIASYTIDKSVNHLQPAKDAASLTSALAVNDIVNRADMEEMESYFYEQLSLYSQFYQIYYANRDGEFIMASRFTTAEDASYYTKIIYKEGEERTVEILERDSDFGLIRRYLDEDDTYDPRIRPWFLQALQAGKLVRTDPYIFFASQQPGITTANPVFNDMGELVGVVGVDIEIAEISDFIATLRIGQRGKAFILNSQGSVIAFPDKEKIRHSQTDNSGLRLANISELDDPVGRRAYQEFRDQFPENYSPGYQFLSFNHEGQVYHAMFSPFQVSRWPWTLVIYLPEDDYLGLLKENRRNNLFFSLAAAMLSSIIGFFIAQSISRPMKDLQQAAHRVENRSLARPFEIHSGYQEILDTALSFENMRRALQVYQERMEELVATRTQELEESNRDLAETVHQLKQAQEDLKRARNQADRANQAKSGFLATISHEIRTPIGGILGYAEMIEQSKDSEAVETYIRTIIQEAKRLTRLLNSLLDLAKIEADELTLEREPVQLQELIKSVVLMVRSRAEKKGLLCEFRIDDSCPEQILGDSLRLSQVLLNLMFNAVKFTEKGSVILNVQGSEGREGSKNILFSIEDTGIGIPEDRIPTIFQEYSQAETSTARRFGGTGLGLPIANRLVQLMGGNLEVESTELQGSRFYFTLSLDRVSKADSAVLDEEDNILHLLEGKRIMVVEDSPTNRDIVVFHLKKTPCSFVLKENGLEAVESYNEDKPDLIIMDVNMPVMDGREASREIRKMGAKIPIIALTANAFQEDVQACLEAGMNDCLVKPFTGRELVKTLGQWLKN